MLRYRVLGVCVCLAIIGCLLAPLVDGRAGEKRQEKKQQTKPVLSVNGELTDKDEKDTNLRVANSPRKVFKVKLFEGKTYQIDLKSGDFDAFLRLEDPQGKELAVNDDAPGGGTLDSQITYNIAKTGEYRIIATCLVARPGKFTLTVAEKDRAAPPAKEKMVFTAKPTELKLKNGKVSLDTELTDKDEVAYGKYHKVFTVKLEEGKTYRIEQRSKQGRSFDPFLFLQDADGNDIAFNDDADLGNLDSRIVHKAANSGTYRIITTTFPGRQTGNFVLEISVEGK